MYERIWLPKSIFFFSPASRCFSASASCEARLEDLQRRRLVLMLAALVLALHHQTRRKVRNPHGGVGPIDVLPPGTAGAIGIDPEVLFGDADLHLASDIGHHRERGEAGLSALLGVERRDSNEAVDPDLAAQVPVGVIALYGERDALDARLLAGLDVEDLGSETSLLAPAQVHAEEHLRPVTGVGPPRARIDRYDGRVLVVLAVQQAAELRLLDALRELSHAGTRLLDGARVSFLRGELEHHRGVGEHAVGLVEEGQLPLEPPLLAQNLLGLLAILPESGVGDGPL